MVARGKQALQAQRPLLRALVRAARATIPPTAHMVRLAAVAVVAVE
jgi:hypothetical protein